MKYSKKIIIGLALCAGIVTSCKEDEAGVSNNISTDKDEITIGPEGGTEQVAVSTNADWVAGSAKPWISISPANGMGSADCRLAIDSTLENNARTTQIRFAAEGQEPKLITITQFGFNKQILLKEPEVEIENSAEYDKRFFEATISTNIHFKIDEENIEYSFAEPMNDTEKVEMEPERANWLTLPKSDDLEVNLDRKARPRTIKVRFRWEMNTAPFTRVAKIRLIPQNPEEDKLKDADGKEIDAVILTVRQKPALKIEDNRSGDSLAIITINKKVQATMSFDTSENMQNWNYVTLWEATDDDLPSQEAIGRVRSVKFIMVNLKEGETLPKEVKHLKYLESFGIQSNANFQLREVLLGEEICELEHLKYLSIYAYGLIKLPDNFIKLGGKGKEKGLEVLDLSSNNFPKLSAITDVVNQENFPHVRALLLSGCRCTDSFSDLSQMDSKGGSEYNGKPIGLHVNITEDARERAAFLKLLTWDNLITLSLSYNFIEGKLPTDSEITTALQAAGKPTRYTEDDFSTDKKDYLDKLVGDTCIWLKTNDNPVTYPGVNGQYKEVVHGQDVPRVLPNARSLSINLNFMTGDMPKWILFHPYFVEWDPEVLVFNQQERGKNSEGAPVLFDNIDNQKYDYKYYYGDKDPGTEVTIQGTAYPLYYRRYVAQ